MTANDVADLFDIDFRACTGDHPKLGCGWEKCVEVANQFQYRRWQYGAYAHLGTIRDRMTDDDVEIVQRFIGPLTGIVDDSHPHPSSLTHHGL